MFKRAGELLVEYEATSVLSKVRLNNTATSELKERLRYLDITIEMVEESVARLETLRKVVADMDPIDQDAWDRWMLQAAKTRILTETFYFNCGRIAELLKDPPGWIPYIGDPGFIGALQVRHKLVEHYDPGQSPFEQGPSFAISSAEGPILQPTMSREWTDKGLYVNAKELADVLERRIANACDKIRTTAAAARPPSELLPPAEH